jgi:hypothetical protein
VVKNERSLYLPHSPTHTWTHRNKHTLWRFNLLTFSSWVDCRTFSWCIRLNIKYFPWFHGSWIPIWHCVLCLHTENSPGFLSSSGWTRSLAVYANWEFPACLSVCLCAVNKTVGSSYMSFQREYSELCSQIYYASSTYVKKNIMFLNPKVEILICPGNVNMITISSQSKKPQYLHTNIWHTRN